MFLRKLLVALTGFCQRTATGLIPNSEGSWAWCGLRGPFVTWTVKQAELMFLMVMVVVMKKKMIVLTA